MVEVETLSDKQADEISDRALEIFSDMRWQLQEEDPDAYIKLDRMLQHLDDNVSLQCALSAPRQENIDAGLYDSLDADIEEFIEVDIVFITNIRPITVATVILGIDPDLEQCSIEWLP